MTLFLTRWCRKIFSEKPTLNWLRIFFGSERIACVEFLTGVFKFYSPNGYWTIRWSRRRNHFCCFYYQLMLICQCIQCVTTMKCEKQTLMRHRIIFIVQKHHSRKSLRNWEKYASYLVLSWMFGLYINQNVYIHYYKEEICKFIEADSNA